MAPFTTTTHAQPLQSSSVHDNKKYIILFQHPKWFDRVFFCTHEHESKIAGRMFPERIKRANVSLIRNSDAIQKQNNNSEQNNNNRNEAKTTEQPEEKNSFRFLWRARNVRIFIEYRYIERRTCTQSVYVFFVAVAVAAAQIWSSRVKIE